MVFETITHEDIVLNLIKKATDYSGLDHNGIMGKKALQKSIYFFHLKNRIFRFRWGDYGPISGEIQQIAYDLISNGNVKVKEIDTANNRAVIQNLLFSEENNPGFSDVKIPSGIDSDLNYIIKFVAGKSPRELELLASVHYWADKQMTMSDEYTADYVHEKLTELKPDAGFKKTDVESAIQSLKDEGFLN